ncbi:MAG: flagellar biosynthesis protein FliQ [Planctomycetota bacterium]
MPEDVLAHLLKEMLWISILLAAPPLVAALLVGLIVGLLQAITSIQEQTLTFVPKLLVIALVFIVGGGWMLRLLMAYTIELFAGIPAYGGL